MTKKLIRRKALLFTLAIVVLLLVNSCGAEELRYDVQSIVISQEYPPFGEYTLSNQEENELLDCLSSIDFSQYQVITEDYPDGDPLVAVITVDSDTKYDICFLRPYLIVDGVWYELNSDHEIFSISEKIESRAWTDLSFLLLHENT